MSPVEILGTCRCSAMNWACVPLPAPGGPTRTRRTSESPGASSEEALVVAQHELALDLLHGLQADADDDEHSCAAEGEPVGAGREVEQQQWQHRDETEVQGSEARDAREDVVEVLRRGAARPDAGH